MSFVSGISTDENHDPIKVRNLINRYENIIKFFSRDENITLEKLEAIKKEMEREAMPNWQSGGNTPDIPVGTGPESEQKTIDSSGEIDTTAPDPVGGNAPAQTNIPS